MPYEPQTWADGPQGRTPMNAERLNRMEAGIEDADTRISSLEGSGAYRANPDFLTWDGQASTWNSVSWTFTRGAGAQESHTMWTGNAQTPDIAGVEAVIDESGPEGAQVLGFDFLRDGVWQVQAYADIVVTPGTNTNATVFVAAHRKRGEVNLPLVMQGLGTAHDRYDGYLSTFSGVSPKELLGFKAGDRLEFRLYTRNLAAGNYTVDYAEAYIQPLLLPVTGA